jgi:hypothetical protein
VRELLVTVEAALPQLVMHFDSVRDFTEGIPTYELQSLQSVRLTVLAYGPPPRPKFDDIPIRHSVSFRLQRADPSLSIEIDGTDRVRVEGLAERMRQTLNHAQTGPQIRRDDLWIMPLAYVVGLVLLLSGIHELPATSLIAPAVAGVLAIAAGVWLFPSLELLAPGQSSRYQRFRAVAFTPVLAVIGSWVFAVVWPR